MSTTVGSRENDLAVCAPFHRENEVGAESFDRIGSKNVGLELSLHEPTQKLRDAGGILGGGGAGVGSPEDADERTLLEQEKVERNFRNIACCESNDEMASEK